MKKGKVKILAFLLLSLLLVFSACNLDTAENDKVSPDWDSERLGLKTPFDNREEFENGTDGKTIEAYSNGYMAYGDLQHILELNTPNLIVKGKVLGFDFRDSSDGENLYIHTMYHVEPVEVFRGEPKTDGSGLIDVMVFGGQTEDHMQLDERIASLSVGSEYIFFLNDPVSWGDGVETNNAGYYAYETGGSLVCYSVSEDENGEYFIPNYYNGGINDNISYGDFKEWVDKVNADVPVQTESEMRKEYVDRWRYTIDTYVADGRMTQEEYDEAKAWLDAYESYTE